MVAMVPSPPSLTHCGVTFCEVVPSPQLTVTAGQLGLKMLSAESLSSTG